MIRELVAPGGCVELGLSLRGPIRRLRDFRVIVADAKGVSRAPRPMPGFR